MRRPLAAAVLVAAALALPPLTRAAGAQGALPTPASVLGFEPGEDRKLPS
jgi:hypothetical protein